MKAEESSEGETEGTRREYYRMRRQAVRRAGAGELGRGEENKMYVAIASVSHFRVSFFASFILCRLLGSALVGSYISFRSFAAVHLERWYADVNAAARKIYVSKWCIVPLIHHVIFILNSQQRQREKEESNTEYNNTQ